MRRVPQDLTRRRAAPGAGWIALALLALGAAPPVAAQNVRRPPPDTTVTYPYEIYPVDAIRGHLMEGEFREPTDVFFDAAARELYAVDSKNATIGIFNEEGVPLFAFGGVTRLMDPKLVKVTAQGTIYVLDSDPTTIKAFNYRGEPLEPVWFSSPEGDVRVGAFTVDAAGNWYVADAERPRLLVYDAEGALLVSIPREDGVGEFVHITGVAVSAEGLIAVIDYKGTPVQIFDRVGHFVSGFGERDIGLQDFTAPVAVTFDEQGYLYVVDMLRHDVKIFDVKGVFQGMFGGWASPETAGRGPGEMLYPRGVAVAPGGAIYVAERFGNRVQIFGRRPKSADEGAAPAERERDE